MSNYTKDVSVLKSSINATTDNVTVSDLVGSDPTMQVSVADAGIQL